MELNDEQVEREEECNIAFAEILREVPGLEGKSLELARSFFWLGWEKGMQWTYSKFMKDMGIDEDIE